ncbi:hypothetical protein BY996DRAFT_8394456 [Phakopsora pachyrhizi]|nr:hypothetical protein BY996DRAFT_8394456 [Phakopsora pachyrhizi]
MGLELLLQVTRPTRIQSNLIEGKSSIMPEELCLECDQHTQYRQNLLKEMQKIGEVVEVVDLMMSLFQAAKALPRAGVIWACQPLKATAISRYNQRSKELVSIEKVTEGGNRSSQLEESNCLDMRTARWNPVRIEHQSDVDSNRSKEFKTAEEPGTDETNQNQTRSERSLSKGFHGTSKVLRLPMRIPADQKTQKNKVVNWPTYRVLWVDTATQDGGREVIDGESQSKAMKLEKQLLLC